MLIDIHIENLVVIEKLDVSFDGGFTVLTGETGAGKSLLIQSVGLVAGERASSDTIRDGCDQGLVEARLVLQSPDGVQRLQDEAYADDGEILIRRVLRRDGNHRVYVNGRMATAQLLQDIVAPEIEIHAQHSQQRMMRPDVQLQLLDRFAGLESAVDQVRGQWLGLSDLEKRVRHLTEQAGNRDSEMDFLRFQLEELDEVAPEPGEASQLQDSINQHKGAALAGDAVSASLDWLRDGDASALDRVYSAEDALGRAGQQLPPIAELAARLGALGEELKDVARELDRFSGDGDDVADVDAMELRLSRLERLARKHNCAVDDLDQARGQLADQLATLERLDEELAELQEQIQQETRQFEASAKKLSERRQKAAGELASQVEDVLRSLEMPNARFEIGGWLEGAAGPTGLDQVEFRLAANPGSKPRPLRKVASGGELSRILLAVQSATGGEQPGMTIVFDEADTGIGGETAVTVGQRMRDLGRRYQVMAVTHTPQVAAFADQQLHLEKSIDADSAVTIARRLEDDDRVDELARMLGDRTDAQAIEHARSLISRAGTPQ